MEGFWQDPPCKRVAWHAARKGVGGETWPYCWRLWGGGGRRERRRVRACGVIHNFVIDRAGTRRVSRGGTHVPLRPIHPQQCVSQFACTNRKRCFHFQGAYERICAPSSYLCIEVAGAPLFVSSPLLRCQRHVRGFQHSCRAAYPSMTTVFGDDEPLWSAAGHHLGAADPLDPQLGWLRLPGPGCGGQGELCDSVDWGLLPSAPAAPASRRCLNPTHHADCIRCVRGWRPREKRGSDAELDVKYTA